MKSIYLLLFTIVVSVSLITGCGGDKKGPAAQKTEKAVTEKAVVEKVKESVTKAAETVEADTAKAIKATKTVVKKTAKKIEKKSAEVEKAVAKVITAKQTAKKPVKPTVAAASKENIKLGSSIFKVKCVLCHGIDGKGSAMAPAFVGNKWIKEVTPSDISSVIKRGRRGSTKKYLKFQTLMPAHPTMPDNELSALVNYIKSIN